MKIHQLAALFLILVTIPAGAATWLTDYDQAVKTAAEQKKPLLIEFGGSDWCVKCKRLKTEVFDTEEFQKYANASLVLLSIDFPAYHKLPGAQQEANDRLRLKFKVEEFPALFLIGPKGEVIRRFGYTSGGPKEFIAKLKPAQSRGKP
ncbi:MAG TPA: thioredoxin family protein [Roseimicrobium sp.]|nr:thioredoxin family protein [Roseimicrobium sp.]